MANLHTLREQLIDILSKDEVLPTNPEEAITGTSLLERIRPYLDRDANSGSIRAYFSLLSGEPTSPIAKVDQGQGYYRRKTEELASKPVGSKKSIEEAEATEAKRTQQREEKFRAIFIRYTELNNQFPMHIEHTKATRQPAGVNEWKFPDVVVVEWGSEVRRGDSLQLDHDMLEIKRSLGEQPFKLRSVELKVELSLSTFRQNFFQCVSNSKWAHAAQLAVAGRVPDGILADEIRRLGTSYDVAVVSFGLDTDTFENLPSADKILRMDDEVFEGEILSQISTKVISPGKERDSLDWEHIRDLRSQIDDFNQLFAWISYCLENKIPFSYSDYAHLKIRYLNR
ncbi:MAG: hypothetical protein K8J31_00150 [Anaerolineae bacterium]|nr:hypothetical protein [Anaerolineae bacterium]